MRIRSLTPFPVLMSCLLVSSLCFLTACSLNEEESDAGEDAASSKAESQAEVKAETELGIDPRGEWVVLGRCKLYKVELSGVYLAAHKNDVDQIKALLAENVPIDEKDKHGMTPLHYAAMEGSAEAIQVLLAGGADPNMKLGFDRTALMLAAATDSTESVEHLLAAGADPNTKDKAENTALLVAARFGTVQSVKKTPYRRHRPERAKCQR